MYFVEDIVSMYRNIDPFLIEELTKKYIEYYKKELPNIDLTLQENIDLIIMPAVAAYLAIEVNKNKLISSNTIDGVISSYMTDEEKLLALKNYAKLIGFTPISTNWENLYNEIVGFIQNNWYNLKTPVSNFILRKFKEQIKNIYIADHTTKEMCRNKIPYIQLPGTLFNNFELNNTNQVNLLNSGFSLSDIEKYKESKNGGYFTLPSFIDLYLQGDIVEEKIKINVINNNFTLPKGYYIEITCENATLLKISQTEKEIWGIVDLTPSFEIVEDVEEVELQIKKYNLPFLEEIEIDELISVADLEIKGFFPMFITLTLFTKNNISNEDKNYIIALFDNYLMQKGRNISKVSTLELEEILLKEKIEASVSSIIESKVYFNLNKATTNNGAFPITKKDIQCIYEFNCNQVSENTVALYIGDINVIKE